VPHLFGDSVRYDVLYDGGRYPPKAVIGLAAERLTGTPSGPYDFKGGRESACFRILQAHGFTIVEKNHRHSVPDRGARTVEPNAAAAPAASDEPSGAKTPRTTSRNPIWTRDELVLALDLYFRVGQRVVGQEHPRAVELSEVLNSLPRSTSEFHSPTFRNPAGVEMKLANFRAHDPTYSGRGLSRGNKLEKKIWDEFSSNLEALRAVAHAIRTGVTEASAAPPVDDEDFFEGQVLSRVHRARERNRKVVAKKKRHVLATTGRLACETCGFDFHAVYGDLGRGFAECHHTVALSQASDRRSVRLSDLVILCANCHRMIHKTRSLHDLVAFRALIRSKH